MKVLKVKTLVLLFTVVFTVISYSVFSQLSTTITGKILNGKNDPVAGVSVTVEGLSSGTSSDIEGRFTIAVPASKPISLKVSAVGYKEKTVTDIRVATGMHEELNLILEEASKKLENVVVRSSGSRRESVNALIAYQKNTSTVSQVISAEAIRRSPDKNTGEILRRIPGASVQ